MKKRTVITTEMSEVWIIHQSPEATVEIADDEPRSISNLLLKPVDRVFEEPMNPQETNCPTPELGK
jgi:hypothetical protein